MCCLSVRVCIWFHTPRHEDVCSSLSKERTLTCCSAVFVTQVLHLSWNLIRLDGGIALSTCLASNSSLSHLDLSYNALGKEGGEALGHALLHNTSVQTLLVSNNSINYTACFAICVAIEENFSLRKVDLDGNPIGEGGGRVLMQIPCTTGGYRGGSCLVVCVCTRIVWCLY